MEEEKIAEYLHDVTNKGVACQSYLRLLKRSESLTAKDRELLEKAYDELMETFKVIKDFRAQLKR